MGGIYFIVCIIVGAFVFANLIIAVVVTNLVRNQHPFPVNPVMHFMPIYGYSDSVSPTEHTNKWK